MTRPDEHGRTSMGAYEYLEDGVTADLTFRARAADLNDLFITCADAMLNAIVADPASVGSSVRKHIRVEAEGLDLLLLEFLEEFIFFKDAEGLVLRVSTVNVTQTDGGFMLDGELAGEPLDAERHHPSADVKAVTLHGLRVEQTAGGWEAQVTVDV